MTVDIQYCIILISTLTFDCTFDYKIIFYICFPQSTPLCLSLPGRKETCVFYAEVLCQLVHIVLHLPSRQFQGTALISLVFVANLSIQEAGSCEHQRRLHLHAAVSLCDLSKQNSCTLSSFLSCGFFLHP